MFHVGNHRRTYVYSAADDPFVDALPPGTNVYYFLPRSAAVDKHATKLGSMVRVKNYHSSSDRNGFSTYSNSDNRAYSSTTFVGRALTPASDNISPFKPNNVYASGYAAQYPASFHKTHSTLNPKAAVFVPGRGLHCAEIHNFEYFEFTTRGYQVLRTCKVNMREVNAYNSTKNRK